MNCIDCLEAGGKDFEKLDENNYCPQCEKTLCPVCEECIFDENEERMCQYCDEDLCEVCNDYISEGLYGLCQDCLSQAAEYYIQHWSS